MVPKYERNINPMYPVSIMIIETKQETAVIFPWVHFSLMHDTIIAYLFSEISDITGYQFLRILFSFLRDHSDKRI